MLHKPSKPLTPCCLLARHGHVHAVPLAERREAHQVFSGRSHGVAGGARPPATGPTRNLPRWRDNSDMTLLSTQRSSVHGRELVCTDTQAGTSCRSAGQGSQALSSSPSLVAHSSPESDRAARVASVRPHANQRPGISARPGPSRAFAGQNIGNRARTRAPTL